MKNNKNIFRGFFIVQKRVLERELANVVSEIESIFDTIDTIQFYLEKGSQAEKDLGEIAKEKFDEIEKIQKRMKRINVQKAV